MTERPVISLPTAPSAGALGSAIAAIAQSRTAESESSSLEAIPANEVVAVFVDDSETDRAIAGRFTLDGLKTTAVIPHGSLSELQSNIFEALPIDAVQVVIMDYRLDDQTFGDDGVFAHRAGALAASIKEHRSEVPIVLLTTEANKIQAIANNQAISLLFDLVVMKDSVSVAVDRKAVVSRIVDLAIGFDRLRSLFHSEIEWSEVARCLGMSEGESSVFAAEWPDPRPLNFSSLLNSVLRGFLAERPGLLLPLPDAAARAGVSVDSLSEIIRENEWLSYAGPFSLINPRVWRSRLDVALSVEDPENGELEAPVRAAAMALRGAPRQYCVVCEERVAVHACALCRRGVDLRHAVIASEMIVPAWSYPRQICFSCIEDGSADGERFSGLARDLVDEIKNGLWES